MDLQTTMKGILISDSNSEYLVQKEQMRMKSYHLLFVLVGWREIFRGARM